jgi:two-component system, NarL family, nitrate/nitrite response regulator NarL
MTKTPPIRVLLVDDQRVMLWGLAELIDGEWPRMMVVGTACDRTDALRLSTITSPDVILIDLDLAGESTLVFLPELLASSAAQVLVCTCLRDRLLHERAIRDGACGIVMKDAPAELLLRAIAAAHGRRSKRASSLISDTDATAR